MKTVDKNHDSVIDWSEFLEMFSQIKKKEAKSFGDAVETKGGAAAKIEGIGGSTHTYLIEERNVMTRMINKTLEGDEHVGERLPMEVDSDDLFHVFADGLVLIKLLLVIDPEIIDIRAVNTGKNLNIYKVRENINLALTACKGIIKVIGIHDDHLLEKKAHLVLALLTQLIKLLAQKSISLKDCPEIMRLS